MRRLSHANDARSLGGRGQRYRFLVATHPRLPLILAALVVLGMMTLILLL